jgi:PAS domain S-box-containing protein
MPAETFDRDDPARSAHVLLIGSDADETRSACEWLAAQQEPALQVTHLASLDAGVTMLANSAVEALVLDLPLDGVCPLDTCRRVRAVAPHVAIVLNTPPDQEAVAAQAVHEGANHYVLKGQPDGRVLASTVRNALVRARAEAELREEQTRNQSLQELLDEGIARLDAQGAIVSANSAMARILGYDRGHELEGIWLRDVYVGPGTAQELLERLASSGKLPRMEAELLSCVGGRMTVQLRGRALPAGPDIRATAEIICTDVTEERRLEFETRHSEQFVIAGTLAAGVACELQRLMAAVAGATDLLGHVIDEGHPRRADLEHLRDTAATAAALTEELLAATRRRGVRPAVLDACSVVERLEPTIQQTVGGEIVMRIPHPSTGAGQVTAVPGELDRVVLELASIARSVEPEGPLTITTSAVYLDATYAREHLALIPGHYVAFVVSTSSQAIDTLTTPDWQAERYFSPQAAERQPALELATVYRMVKQSGGHFTIRRAPGAGTTFKVYLPRLDSPGHLGTVLLVEDEPSIRRGGRQLLELLDYRVLEAADPHEAIWLASRFGSEIDLLIADVVLPGMSGREMAERLLEGQYVSQVLYMSGLLKETLVERAALPPDATFIEKPFTVQELAARVREMLGGRV